LTVQRGVGGTAAASHVQNTAISLYRPPRDIEQLALRVAAWLYKSPDARPASLPEPLAASLDGLRRVRV
jgi:hypothetical protein